MLPDGVGAHVRRLSVLHLQGHDAQGPDVNLVFMYFYLHLYLYLCLCICVLVLINICIFVYSCICICFMFIHKALMPKVPPWCHMPAGSQSGEEDKKQS